MPVADDATGSPTDRVSPTSCPGCRGSGANTGHAGPLADDLQLGDGVGALQVGGDEQRGVALRP